MVLHHDNGLKHVRQSNKPPMKQSNLFVIYNKLPHACACKIVLANYHTQVTQPFDKYHLCSYSCMHTQ